MKSYFRVITAPTADTCGTTLVLRSEAPRRYIFGNASEGFQRSLMETSTPVKNVQDFFMTGTLDWQRAGGLLGYLLTNSDVKVEQAKQNGSLPDTLPKFNLYGPPNLKQTLATSRRFIFRKNFPVNITEYQTEQISLGDDGNPVPSWTDGHIRVWAMPVSPTQGACVESDGGTARKRSFDEAMGWSEEETPSKRMERYDVMRNTILSDMFNSTWRIDTLFEGPLSEVQMPCKIFVRDPETKAIKEYEGPVPGDGQELPDIKVLTRKPWPAALIGRLPPTQPSTTSLSYIVRNMPQRGKFNAKKAMELGLKDKTKYKNLTAGQAVQNEKGEMITPEMVLEPGNSGFGCAIVELPSIDYIEPLVSRQEWSTDFIMENVTQIIWILAPDVLGDPRLKKFMESMSSHHKIEHIISSSDLSPNRLSFDQVAGQSYRLSTIDASRFHVPNFDDKSVPQDLVVNPERVNPIELAIPNTRPVNRCVEYEFESTAERTAGILEIPPFNGKDSVAKIPIKVPELSQEALKNVARHRADFELWKSKIPLPDTEVISLGTGSALPSKYRNVSGHLVRVPGHGAYLFDAGENTMGQILRIFGPEDTRQLLKELRMIWISHLHADHHLGITSVISNWRDVVHGKPAIGSLSTDPLDSKPDSPRLAVVSDQHMIEWLREYAEIENFGYGHLLPLGITAENPMRSPLHLFPLTGEPQPFPLDEFTKHTRISSIRAAKVEHCAGARAVAVTFPSSLKISYSGDCRPSPWFIKIGQDSTLLIHESTFDDELRGDAIAKKHSTTGEALRVGQRMNAKCVLLTHFSQRYAKFPIIDRSGSTTDEPVQELPELDAGATISDHESADAMDIEEPPVDDPAEEMRPSTPLLVQQRTASKYALDPNSDMKVGVAFDYMRVKLGDFAELEYFVPPLVEMFREETEEIIHRAAKDLMGVKAAKKALGAEKNEKKSKSPKKKKKNNNKKESNNGNTQKVDAVVGVREKDKDDPEKTGDNGNAGVPTDVVIQDAPSAPSDAPNADATELKKSQPSDVARGDAN